jgi:hypothetical protein
VGAGGTGVAGAAGNVGGDSSVSNQTPTVVCLAKGGNPGQISTGTGGAAGTGGLASARTGDSGYDGGWGTTGRDSSTGRGGGGASSAGTGADGANDGTAGDYATYTMTGRTGPTGSGPGGDGGGANTDGSAPASARAVDAAGRSAPPGGGAGANGKIIHSAAAWPLAVTLDTLTCAATATAPGSRRRADRGAYGRATGTGCPVFDPLSRCSCGSIAHTVARNHEDVTYVLYTAALTA